MVTQTHTHIHITLGQTRDRAPARKRSHDYGTPGMKKGVHRAGLSESQAAHVATKAALANPSYETHTAAAAAHHAAINHENVNAAEEHSSAKHFHIGSASLHQSGINPSAKPYVSGNPLSSTNYFEPKKGSGIAARALSHAKEGATPKEHLGTPAKVLAANGWTSQPGKHGGMTATHPDHPGHTITVGGGRGQAAAWQHASHEPKDGSNSGLVGGGFRNSAAPLGVHLAAFHAGKPTNTGWVRNK